MRNLAEHKYFIITIILAVFFLVKCTSSSNDFYYMVKKGDTLSGIAGWYGVNVNKLQKDNYIINPNKIQVGTVLKISVNDIKSVREKIANFPDSISIPNDEDDDEDDDVQKLKPISISRRGFHKIKIGEARKYVGNLVRPLGTKGRISSPYGYRHGHFHKGIDYSAKRGTPIYAAHAGKVVVSGSPWSGYGNVVAIDGHGLLTLYAHCNRLFVRPGQRVKRGEIIAEVGTSGRTTGAHLHYETRLPSKKGYNIIVDPAIFY